MIKILERKKCSLEKKSNYYYNLLKRFYNMYKQKEKKKAIKILNNILDINPKDLSVLKIKKALIEEKLIRLYNNFFIISKLEKDIEEIIKYIKKYYNNLKTWLGRKEEDMYLIIIDDKNKLNNYVELGISRMEIIYYQKNLINDLTFCHELIHVLLPSSSHFFAEGLAGAMIKKYLPEKIIKYAEEESIYNDVYLKKNKEYYIPLKNLLLNGKEYFYDIYYKKKFYVYSQAISFVNFIIKKYKYKKFKKFYLNILENNNIKNLIIKYYNKTIESLEKEWKESINLNINMSNKFINEKIIYNKNKLIKIFNKNIYCYNKKSLIQCLLGLKHIYNVNPSSREEVGYYISQVNVELIYSYLYIDKVDIKTNINLLKESLYYINESISIESKFSEYYRVRAMIYGVLSSVKNTDFYAYKFMIDLRKAKKINSKNTNIYIEEGKSYFYRKKYEKALELFFIAKKVSNYNNLKIYTWLGLTYFNLKEYKKAKKNLRYALKINPNIYLAKIYLNKKIK